MIDNLLKVRSLLSHYNVEVLEFYGGEYNTDLLDDSDIILVLPPDLPKAFNYHFTVGKGQYMEILRGHDHDIPVLFVMTMGEELYIGENPQMEVTDINWKSKYCFIECDNRLTTLEEVFGDEIKKVSSEFESKTIKNNYPIPHLALYRR